MVEIKRKVEISFGTNSSQFEYIKENIQGLVEKFNFNHQQLSNILDLPINELENLMNNKGSISNEQFEKIENKITMLNFGFESFDAKERAIILLNDLITNYMLSTGSLSKVINVEEHELINFRQHQLTDRNIELKICVNVIILHFVLHD
ncbi:HTH domain-containing protein [Lysinibacillus fusiformis]|uniref:HTH domain-containing protein n=1 Tax=Lysinibacillus fusiformis TaxID=28031 RepID=UPI00046A17C0|nr:HTH domain-containing protein [Lysinibacillus fusiformis]